MAAKIISFINMKGGVAKTTLLVNTADFLARRSNRRVLILDVDPQFNATQMLMDPSEYVKYISNGNHTILDVFDRGRKIASSVVNGQMEIKKPELGEITPV